MKADFILDLLENIAEKCPKEKNLLGMDIGRKTIGLALSDSAHCIATPLKTIQRTKFSKDIRQLEDIIKDYDVGGYVLGYPINMDGSEGPRCQSVRDFALEFASQLSDSLKPDSGLWIALWDERLSTASVDNFVNETVNIKKSRAKEKGITDKLAAQHILQGALDFMP
ncbi:MAG: Holliday junction resolvase RuvX [Alphaproteobacteria bacterium]|nr:Holliday junction resolvase RuvX [Alphaproteobacteria bacterium]